MRQVIEKLNIGFVNFINQQDGLNLADESLPPLAPDNVVADVMYLRIAQL